MTKSNFESNPKLRIVVLIGGSGSNLQAMIDASQNTQNPPVHFELIGVISHNPEAYGLIRAQQANLPHFVVNPSLFDSKQDFEQAILAILDELKPDLICLAGFMRVLSPDFIQAYPNQIINIHPSLLPKYPGLHTHKQVIANRDTEHGATVHWVTEHLDAGPIIAQQKLAVSPDDTEESIKAKVLKLEHVLYPLIINNIALGMYKKVTQ
jgi:phosphoribosylglycinamide formyltransferase-1